MHKNVFKNSEKDPKFITRKNYQFTIVFGQSIFWKQNNFRDLPESPYVKSWNFT